MDLQIVDAARHGSKDAFGVLAAAEVDRLFAVAARIVRDHDRAADAVQQALVMAWRDLPRLRDPERFEGWLYKVLVHACYAELRRHRALPVNVHVLPSAGNTGDSFDDVANRDALERALQRLTPEQRAILVLHHYVGLEPVEIARILGLPRGTVRSRLYYGHQAMRAAIEADERPVRATGGRR